MSFLYNKNIIHILTLLTGFYNIYYIWWRATYSINYSAFLFSIVLLFCEVQGIINFFLFALMTWDIDDNEILMPLHDVLVDVFIPTYNEEIKILEATIIGSVNMRYEHTTYVLDDGCRTEVEILAKQYGCEYLTRSDNKHAKAGNINEALKKTKGEFVVVLDADMVPQPDLIEKTLGYFEDSKTAIVQLPQEFYNLDSVQHQNGNTYWHEQQMFYHVIQPGKNRINSAFWCGSPSIVRRKALESIGGVATDSITEDFLTSIRLNSKGWNIKYHNEVLAFGIAPQSLHAFNLQRLRWAQGAMKIFKSKDNPLIVKNLTLKQRLSHFSSIFTYFDSYQKLVYFLAPSILLLTGMVPVKVTSSFQFVIRWVPYFLLTMMTNMALGRGYFKYFEVEKYNTLKMFTFIKASFTLVWSKSNIFRVTPKTVESSVKLKERIELRVQTALLVLIILSIVIGMINTVWNSFIMYSSLTEAVVAIFWSFFNAYILFLSLRDVLKRMYYRQDYRFPIKLESIIIDSTGDKIDSVITDLSQSGISLKSASNKEIDKQISIDIYLPDGVLNVEGKVVYSSVDSDGMRRIGIMFNELNIVKKNQLYNFLFVTVPRKMYNHRTLKAKEFNFNTLPNPGH